MSSSDSEAVASRHPHNVAHPPTPPDTAHQVAVFSSGSQPKAVAWPAVPCNLPWVLGDALGRLNWPLPVRCVQGEAPRGVG